MKLLLLGIIVPLMLITNNNFAQTTEPNNNEIVLNQLKVVYGDYYQKHIADSPDQIKFFTDFYDRCEFISKDEAPSNIPNISSLDLKDKYNPEIIKHDFSDSFDETNFIVFKYQFDFYNSSDKYYLIYNTNTVLKINKLDL